MKEKTLIILLLFSLAFDIYFVCFVKYKLKCDVDKRSKFVEECIKKIDLIHQPQNHDATSVIMQCEETSKNLYCTY
jgi:hypothetical protein